MLSNYSLFVHGLAAALLLTAGCDQGDEVDRGERIYAQGCKVAGTEFLPPRLKLTRVLAATNITRPVKMLPSPDGRLFFLAQPGVIFMAPAVTPQGAAMPWMDIQARVEDGCNECGLLGMAFDPRFSQNGRFYLNYTRRMGGQLQTVISRFTVRSPPLGAADAQSEAVIMTINQPYNNHNGGEIEFGPDGYLYIGMGDGGSGGDPEDHGQRMDSLLGKFLRIDVSGASGYKVPPDNPFVGRAGARPEIWAVGLRNPWRFSFDPIEGTLWTGDVGQGAREEIDIIEKGRNYGWRLMEGTLCYNPDKDCQRPDLVLPVHDYPRSDGKSVTGGVVYRGKAIPGLFGTYLFADYVDRALWGLNPGPSGAYTRTTLIDDAANVSGFGVDPAGEVYIMDHTGGRFFRLDAADANMMGSPGWPERLSDTGCFADLPARRLVRGVLHYSVSAPLWADGADKERGLVLPAGSTMGFTERGAWELPSGTILIKSFTRGGRALETRFLLKDGTAFRGATYRWNAEGTDALLLRAGGTADVGGMSWYFPSRADCLSCHTKASGQALGLSTAQMNRDHDLFGSGKRHAQVDALARLGYFTAPPGRPAAELPRFPEPEDHSAPLQARARAYLHANCAHCHMPGGLANATIDLRAETPLKETKSCDVVPQQGNLGVAGARILAPGSPERSTLWLRMVTRDPAARMPNLATSVPDDQGIAVVKAWIEGLKGCTE
jgi:uncharacterized repeat protein (TIGR03806 family)